MSNESQIAEFFRRNAEVRERFFAAMAELGRAHAAAMKSFTALGEEMAKHPEFVALFEDEDDADPPTIAEDRT